MTALLQRLEAAREILEIREWPALANAVAEAIAVLKDARVCAEYALGQMPAREAAQRILEATEP